MADHTLTPDEIGALKLALARVLVEGKKTAERVDQTTDDPTLYGQAHSSIAAERLKAERLIEMLDTAEAVVIQLPD
ncbi:hypothetical protein [Methylobacterium sp. SD21]|uniref:hypothetical protein n=1 Tax=Methylobacterium litchii TaxID=3138810 RepID=UPI00313EFEA1